MGVPGLFGWLKRSCPETIEPFGVEETVSQDGCDNLYLDLNYAVHRYTHERYECMSDDEDDVRKGFEHVKAYIVRLVHLAAPSKVLFLAVDGVGPRAKLNMIRRGYLVSAHLKQQSTRIEKEVRKQMEEESKQKLVIDPLPDFDSTSITPGTAFMELLSTLLQEMIQEQSNLNPEWKKLLVILSTAADPGEGEHKIMKFIRHQRCSPGYNPNTRHAVVSQDGDLILLSLLTHEPHFKIIREDRNDNIKGLVPLTKLDIGILRRYLKRGLGELNGEQERVFVQDARGVAPRGMDNQKMEMEDNTFERMLDDFVFILAMVGNDFLPGIPSLDIFDRGGGLNLLMHAYKCMRRREGGFITERGMVDFPRLQKFLQEVAQDEEESYKRKKRQHENVRKRMLNKYEGDASEKDSDSGRSFYKYEGESLAKLTQEELQEELEGRMELRDLEYWNECRRAEPLRLGSKGYREHYYRRRFGATAEDDMEQTVRKLCGDYLKGLAWVFAYYVRGNNPVATSKGSLVLQQAKQPKPTQRKREGRQGGQESDGPLYASWDWFYPHRIAPLMQDLVKFNGDPELGNEILRPWSLDLAEYDQGKLAPRHGPLLPLIQQMCITHPNDAPHRLPKKLVDIIQSGSSKAAEKYGLYSKFLMETFPDDLSNLITVKEKLWDCSMTVELPLMDFKTLGEVVTMPGPDDEEFTIEEEDRNSFTPTKLFFHKESKMAKMLAESKEDASSQNTKVVEIDQSKDIVIENRCEGGRNWEPNIGECFTKSKERGASKSLNAVEKKDQEELLIPLVIDDGDDDDSAIVLVASIDIPGASTEPFVSELLPGVDIDDTPLGRAIFQLPCIARNYYERGGWLGKDNRGGGRWEDTDSGDSWIRGPPRESAWQPAENGGKGSGNSGWRHPVKNEGGVGSGQRAWGRFGGHGAGNTANTGGHYQTHRRDRDMVQENQPMMGARNSRWGDWSQSRPGAGGGRNWDVKRGVGKTREDDERGGGRTWEDNERGGGKTWKDNERGGGKIWEDVKRGGGRTWEDNERGGGKTWKDNERGGGKIWEDVKRGGGRTWEDNERGGGKTWKDNERGGGKIWEDVKRGGGRTWEDNERGGGKTWKDNERGGGKIWEDVKRGGGRTWEDDERGGGKIWEDDERDGGRNTCPTNDNDWSLSPSRIQDEHWKKGGREGFDRFFGHSKTSTSSIDGDEAGPPDSAEWGWCKVRSRNNRPPMQSASGRPGLQDR